MKMKFLKFILFALTILGFVMYYNNIKHQNQVISGETMNTYYQISIRSPHENTLLKNQIKNELQQINAEMSAFDPMSDLSLFNRNTDNGWIDVPVNLSYVLKEAYKIYNQTNGYFDPSIGKLIDIWGFGSNKVQKLPTDEEVKAAKQLVGLNKIEFNKDFRQAKKRNSDITINLSAIAKGYAVDRIVSMLEKLGYTDFIVDIGGEVYAKGSRSKKDSGWNVGVARPDDNQVDNYEYIVKLKDTAVATSGDYRNYFYVDDKRYSHTIDPKTGYPVEHNLASVTVFDKSCMKADALATGIMSMGEEKGLAFANNNRLSVIMFVRTDAGFRPIVSNEAKKLLEKQQEKVNAK